MKRKIFVLILSVAALTIGCDTKPKQKPVVADDVPTLPEGAIPIMYDGLIYLEGMVEGVKGNFIFDTGAHNLYLDSTWYADNSFDNNSFAKGSLPGTGIRRQEVRLIFDTLEFIIQNHVYKTNIVPIFQLKSICGDISDGIVGKECFRSHVMEINYTREYMKLHESIDSVNLADYQRIPLTRDDNRLYVPLSVEINDSLTIDGNFLLDTGAGIGVSLTSVMAKKYRLNNILTRKTEYFTVQGGVGGESKSFSFRAKRIKIGGFQFDDVTMGYSINRTGAMSSDKYAGLLGNKILERFDIIIDLINDDLYLKANENYGTPFVFPRSGFGYVGRSKTYGSWIVSGIYKDSNAEKSGLQINDKIIAVDGNKVPELPFRSLRKYIENRNDIELTIERNGETKVFRFKLEPILQ
ncbi:MAG: aspartyl protease family protein [Tannerella sp.]|jgi:predicted aspartyl protease|nr:aspartyl protease family protein [Tannerella sp.]